jgi:ribonucleotide reductase alpha subunit
MQNMQVVKRDGRKEDVAFEKVQERIAKSSVGLAVNPTKVAQGVLTRLIDGITTTELDTMTAHLAYSWSTIHPDYGELAARIAISSHQKNTPSTFLEATLALDAVLDKTGAPASLLSPDLVAFVKEHAAEIEAAIHYDRDFLLDYFGFKTLEKAYLLRDTARNLVERPQHLWMRLALGLWSHNLPYAFETYDLLSQKFYTHATPTLFNAGTKRPQLSSCFLLSMKEDSISGIYETLSDCAKISQYGGGIGLHISNIRAQGSLIRGTGGVSNGIVPMMRVYNNTARYVDQCFAPETLVYTENGPKRIETITVTDKVLTSDGMYNQVNAPVRHNYKGKILTISVKHSISSVRVTPEHPLKALCGQKKGLNYSVIRNRIDKELVEVEYVDAKDLHVDDYIAFPIPKYERDISSITLTDCRFYGILLGDGYISHELSGITLNLETKVATRTFVEEYLAGHGLRAYVYEDPDTRTVRIKWSTASPGFKFTKSQLYDAAGEKHVEPAFLHLPLPKVQQVLRGIIETDGCIAAKEVSIELSSDNLIESIRYMLLRFGALCSGYDRDRIGTVSSYKGITIRKTTKVLRIPRISEITEFFPDSPASEYFTYFRHGDHVYSRIETIDESEYDGVLHDFEIDSVHDYTIAHLGLAHNGGGKRNGSFAMYLEPWHADVEQFLEMKKNTGSEEERARDLFYALWVPDLFMERVETDGLWTLFCPSEAPGLADVVGADFVSLYTRYEAEKRGRKTVSARKLWSSIMESQIETGTPYLLYKDAANLKSNQQNLGVIKSSNLCVAAHTPILTKGGELPIGMLVGQEVQVWNGNRWSTVLVEQTSTGTELLTVEFDDIITYNDGFVERRKSQVTCTFYHKFFRCEGDESRRWQTSERVEAHRLEAGDRLGEWEDDLGAHHSPRVRAVIQMGLFAPTFCFAEAENHAGVFAGLLTGQCAEIIEYSSPTETAVCNLASMSLPAFVKCGDKRGDKRSEDKRSEDKRSEDGASSSKKVFDFALFRKVVKVAVRNLNRVIDVNFYPIPEAEVSNKRHRPIGLGIQGLADVFAMLGYAWESPEAALLNKRIFAHMYYAALEASCDLAATEGVYPTYHGSPLSKGKFQYDLWNLQPLVDDGLDWDTLGHYISRIGVRNSLLVAAMPTASTSQILGNCECMEPYATHIFTRRTLAGEFIVVNKHLVSALLERGLWSVALKDAIVANNGSVQGLREVPEDIQALFKTVWEIKQKTLVDMAAERGPYICQSQSLNLFMGDPDYKKLSSMHFYAWKRGLKTGIYYLRTRAVASAQKFTVEPVLAAGVKEVKEEKECVMCSA